MSLDIFDTTPPAVHHRLDIVKGSVGSMADGDVFTRTVTARWRSVVEALRDGLPADDCARRLDKALAKELRKTGGLTSPQMHSLLPTGSTSEADLVAALRRLTRQQCFDRVVPRLVGDGTRFRNYDQAQRFVAYCLDKAHLNALARSLARNPEARRLQTPRRARTSASNILDEGAPLGPNAS